jgi:invasion protein IalB
VIRAWLLKVQSGLDRITPYAVAALFLSLPTIGLSEEHFPARRFGDWEVICETPKGEIASPAPTTNLLKNSCRAVQRLAAKATDETVFMLTVLPGEKAASVAIVSVPLGGYLVPGVEFSIDGRKPYKLLIETCTTAGCHAGFPLTGRVEKELRTGTSASFRIWTTKSKPADVSVSLNGFADAMAHLGRRS